MGAKVRVYHRLTRGLNRPIISIGCAKGNTALVMEDQ